VSSISFVVSPAAPDYRRTQLGEDADYYPGSSGEDADYYPGSSGVQMYNRAIPI